MSEGLTWERQGADRLRLAGRLDRASVPALMAAIERRGDRQLTLDLSGVDHIDTAGVAMLAVLRDRLDRVGGRLAIVEVPEAVSELLGVLPYVAPARPRVERDPFLVRVGEKTWDLWGSLGNIARLALETLHVVFVGPFTGQAIPRGAFSTQAVRIGVDAFPIVAMISLLVGLIVAFQAAFQLERFGAAILVANLTGMSMIRELGPLMTAIILAGRSGSAIAAEIGTMVVSEEVAAMRTMGLRPVRHLVAPRMLAIAVTGPLLTVMSMVLGIIGGFVIGIFYLELAPDQFFRQTFRFVGLNSFLNGMSKSLIFSLLVGFIGCYTGLNIQGGATAVGAATTRSVVASIFAIVIADSIVTTLTVRSLAGGM